ncbi:hypothetical protein FRC15_007147, partial [Serendipita sp. 397]
MRLAPLFSVISLQAITALAAPVHVLCGGYWWGGPSDCGVGYACYYVNVYFSVCVPKTDWTVTSITRIDGQSTTTIGVTRVTDYPTDTVTRLTGSDSATVSRTTASDS